MPVTIKIEECEPRCQGENLILLEIMCQRLVEDTQHLLTLIENTKESLSTLKDYQAKKQLLYEVMDSDHIEEERLVYIKNRLVR